MPQTCQAAICVFSSHLFARFAYNYVNLFIMLNLCEHVAGAAAAARDVIKRIRSFQ